MIWSKREFMKIPCMRMRKRRRLNPHFTKIVFLERWYSLNKYIILTLNIHFVNKSPRTCNQSAKFSLIQKYVVNYLHFIIENNTLKLTFSVALKILVANVFRYGLQLIQQILFYALIPVKTGDLKRQFLFQEHKKGLI